MLAAAIALGVLATPDGGQISFSLAGTRAALGAEGTQHWIVLLFALAFFVKAPLFPLHGWVPETYRSTPIPVLALLSGVLSKVGVYGFLRIVLPVMPEGSQHWQELFIIIAVFSILYGSVLAFSQDNVRLVVAYSSIAQLGFIVLGIFALDDEGRPGRALPDAEPRARGGAAVPDHRRGGLRAAGSESLAELGGMAFRAPVLAALFLITTFATLAMPGSANFIGELLILFGSFEDKLVYGLVASVGVVLAAVYMIRLFQGDAQPRRARRCESRDIGGSNLAAIAPLVAVIVALGVYPHFVVSAPRASHRSAQGAREGGQARAAAPARRAGDRCRPHRRRRGPGARDRLQGAVAAVRARRRLGHRADGRACSRSRFVRRALVPALTAVALLTAIGLTIWIWEPGDREPIIEGALGVDALSLGISMLFYVAGLVTIVLSLRSTAPLEAGHGEYYALLLGSIAGHGRAGARPRTSSRSSSASSCSRSRSTCSAPPSCAGACRSSPG